MFLQGRPSGLVFGTVLGILDETVNQDKN